MIGGGDLAEVVCDSTPFLCDELLLCGSTFDGELLLIAHSAFDGDADGHGGDSAVLSRALVMLC